MTSEFFANYFWPNSFFRSSLLFILPVTVLGSSETNSTWMKIKQTHSSWVPLTPVIFYQLPAALLLSPFTDPQTGWHSGTVWCHHFGGPPFVKFFSYPLKLDAALWCTLINEIWVAVKYATSNKKVGNHWDRPPSLSISSSTLVGTYKAVVPLSWSQGEEMWNKGPRKAMVDKWHEQERHLPCYNPLQIWDC